MARHVVAGIDIGSFEIKVVVAEGNYSSNNFTPKVIGTGTAESRGIERGYIVNTSETAHALATAVAKAERMANVRVRRAYVSFGGLGLGSISTTGSVVISRADLEITDRDVATVMEVAESNIPPASVLNKRIINSIPIEYKIDGKVCWGEPVGLKATKLEVKALFITCLEHHLTDLIKAVEDAGVEVIDVVAGPVAASFVTVTKKERRVGCLLADIGAETLSLITFENNNPTSLEVFPVGGSDITNDIALGLKISLDEAENVKLGGISRSPYSKKKLDEIIAARLTDCFEIIQSHLKKIGRDSLLPAGILMTGGGANTPAAREFAQELLNLPSEVAEIRLDNSGKNKIHDNVWARACGLVVLGFDGNDESSLIGTKSKGLTTERGQKLLKRASHWISQLLP